MDSESNCATGVASTYTLYYVPHKSNYSITMECNVWRMLQITVSQVPTGTGLTAHKLLLLDTTSQYMNNDIAQYNNPTSPSELQLPHHIQCTSTSITNTLLFQALCQQVT
jgi:hypothetical protein